MQSEKLRTGLMPRGDLEHEFIEHAREREPLKILANSFESAPNLGLAKVPEFRARPFDELPLCRGKKVEGPAKPPRLDGIPGQGRDLPVTFGQGGHNSVSLLIGNGPENDGEIPLGLHSFTVSTKPRIFGGRPARNQLQISVLDKTPVFWLSPALTIHSRAWGYSSVGRALQSHCRGQRFESA